MNARALALQGIGFAALLVAAQGLSPLATPSVDGGAIRLPTVWDHLREQAAETRRQRIASEDQLAADFIVAVITTEFLNV